MGTIVLTGAGASKPLKFPTTAEFFDQNATGVPWLPNHREIYSHLSGFLGSKTIDVEDVLRLLDPASDFFETEAGRFTQAYTIKRSGSVIDLDNFHELALQMKNRCFDLYGDLPKKASVKNLYHDFLDIVGWKETTVDFFTTNYDLATDRLLQIADDANIPASDGFNRWNRFDAKDYEFPDKRGIRVYRLHGSMSWVDEDGEIINNRTIARTNRRHLFIAPGYKGDPRSSNEPEPIVYAHDQLEKTLLVGGSVVVVGFSFRDPYLNSVFNDAFAKNERLSMVYVNPEVPKHAESGFPAMLEKHNDRIKVLELRFGDRQLNSAIQDAFEVLGQRLC